jgi:lipoprotein signal peptidase
VGSLRIRRTVAVATALAAAAVDLSEKALAGTTLHHLRSPFALLLMAAVAAGLLVLVPRIPSGAIAVGAGIAAGGALGNLVSALVWSEGVPDPIVVRVAAGGVAFNLADVFVLTGDAVLLCAAAVHALRNRGRLRERV